MERCTLWQALAAMRIEPAGATRTFGSRLALENGWDARFASRVEAEYRRFLYLAARADGEVTPSDAVDQAWHLHLSYTRHYWDVLCGEILKRSLHHGPSAGGAAEAARYHRQYEATRALYAATFGAAPPADIWPDATLRFAGDWRRVDVAQTLLLPRRALRTGLALALALPLAACAGVLGAGAALPMVALGLGLFLMMLGLTRQPRRARKRADGSGCGSFVADTGGDSCADGGSGGDCAGCGGGCGGD